MDKSEIKEILYIGGFELPDRNAAAQRVVANARLFLSLGYNVTFVEAIEGQDAVIAHREPCFGFEHWSIRKSNKMRYAINEVIEIADKMSNLTFIVAYNYPAISLMKLRRYFQGEGVKVIADATEWYNPQGGSIIHDCVKRFDTFLRMKVVHPRIDGVIAISTYLYKYYEKKVNTVLIPPLVDINESKWNTCIESGDKNKIRIVYAGSPGRYKDKLNLILQAMKKVHIGSFAFRVVGLTKKQYLNYYPDDELLLEDLSTSITFLGRITHEETIQEVRNADFSLFYREKTRVTDAGFPTKFTEAISCGTPVITNHTSDLDKYLVDGINGFWIDDLEKDLERISKLDIKTLKNMKANVERCTFDCHNYQENMKQFLNAIIIN